MTSFREGMAQQREPDTSMAHAHRSANVDSAVELVPARSAGISAGPTTPRQRIALCRTGRDSVTIAGVEALDGVDHTHERLGETRARGVEVEADLLAVTRFPAIRRQGRPWLAVDLEAVAQAGFDSTRRPDRPDRSAGARRG